MLPFDQLNRAMREVTDTMRVMADRLREHNKAVSIYGTPTGVAIQLPLRSDLKADVYLGAKIGFDTSTSIVTQVPTVSQTLPNL